MTTRVNNLNMEYETSTPETQHTSPYTQQTSPYAHLVSRYAQCHNVTTL